MYVARRLSGCYFDPISGIVAAVSSLFADTGAAMAGAGLADAAAGAVVDVGASAAATTGIAGIGEAALAALPAAADIAIPAAAAAGTAFTISDALSLTGSAVSAAGQISAANAQKGALQFNQQQTAIEAQQVQLAGAANARQVEQDNTRRYGMAAAALAASGVDPSQGTPLDIMADITRQGELSRQLTLYNANTQAQQLRVRGQLYGAQAGQVGTAGAIGAGTTILTSLGRTLGNRPGGVLSTPVF